jgi:hypothetical protein
VNRFGECTSALPAAIRARRTLRRKSLPVNPGIGCEKRFLGPIFLRNSFSLKELSPGAYEYDIFLRDELKPG